MSNSALVVHTNISPNSSNPRNHEIDTITIHCVVGQVTAESLGNIFAPSSRQASSNYGVDKDGRVGMYVEEKNRSWCSSSASNDNRAVTIEVASDTEEPYAVNDKALAALIELCADICQRNGIAKLLWQGDKSLIGQVDKQNMTVHRWFANKSCPGDYLYNLHGEIAEEVNKKLTGQVDTAPGVLYRVQVGAFSSKSNADNMVASVEKAGFDTYLVQVDGLYKVQVGAFANKDNAESQKQALIDKGFDAFITTVTGSAVSSSTVLKSITEIALEVINGLWGNGTERTQKLQAAGYDPTEVQAMVNKLLA